MVFAALTQHCIQSYSFCYSCRRCRRCQILWIIDQRLKIHTNMFLLITSLIFNGFSIWKSFGKLRLRAFQPYHQILCILKHVKDVEDNLWHLWCRAIMLSIMQGMVFRYTWVFILRRYKWHIHAGSWSLVNCWQEALTRPYIRYSWILMNAAVGHMDGSALMVIGVSVWYPDIWHASTNIRFDAMVWKP